MQTNTILLAKVDYDTLVAANDTLEAVMRHIHGNPDATVLIMDHRNALHCTVENREKLASVALTGMSELLDREQNVKAHYRQSSAAAELRVKHLKQQLVESNKPWYKKLPFLTDRM